MAFPAVSVMVMIVLLKVAATCATPCTTFFFSFLRGRPGPFFSAAMLLRHLLLAGDCLGGPLAGAGVGVGALATHGQTAAMAQAAIAAEVHQPLDVHGHVATKIALNQIIPVDHLANLNDFRVGKFSDPAIVRDPHLLADFPGLGGTDTMDVAQADFDPLLRWDI